MLGDWPLCLRVSAQESLKRREAWGRGELSFLLSPRSMWTFMNSSLALDKNEGKRERYIYMDGKLLLSSSVSCS